LYEIADVAGLRINFGQVSTAKKMAQKDHEILLRLDEVGLGANIVDDATLQEHDHGEVARLRIREMRGNPK